MPSREGFDTWLRYEFFFLKLAVAGTVVVLFALTVLGMVERSGLDVGEFVLGASALAVLASVAAAWWLGRGGGGSDA